MLKPKRSIQLRYNLIPFLTVKVAFRFLFSNTILKHFPTVKPLAWMDFTGPVFLFYDEVLADMGDVGEIEICFDEWIFP